MATAHAPSKNVSTIKDMDRRATLVVWGVRIFPFILGHSVIPLGPILIERYTSLLNY